MLGALVATLASNIARELLSCNDVLCRSPPMAESSCTAQLSFSLWSDSTYIKLDRLTAVETAAKAGCTLVGFDPIMGAGLVTKGNETKAEFQLAPVVLIEMGYNDDKEDQMSNSALFHKIVKQSWYQALSKGRHHIAQVVFVFQPSYRQVASIGKKCSNVGLGRLRPSDVNLGHYANSLRFEKKKKTTKQKKHPPKKRWQQLEKRKVGPRLGGCMER